MRDLGQQGAREPAAPDLDDIGILGQLCLDGSENGFSVFLKNLFRGPVVSAEHRLQRDCVQSVVLQPRGKFPLGIFPLNPDDLERSDLRILSGSDGGHRSVDETQRRKNQLLPDAVGVARKIDRILRPQAGAPFGFGLQSFADDGDRQRFGRHGSAFFQQKVVDKIDV